MAKRATEVSLVCEKCGKAPEVKKEESNHNWKVYDTKVCGCGGKFKFKID